MCERLEIRIIAANSPQAKGRVERNNGVHQDRLVKKLRRKGIRKAAVVLRKIFLFQIHIRGLVILDRHGKCRSFPGYLRTRAERRERLGRWEFRAEHSGEAGGGNVPILRLELLGVVSDVLQHGMKVFDVEQKQAVVVGNLEDQGQNAFPEHR
jgi:hypothetical protein